MKRRSAMIVTLAVATTIGLSWKWFYKASLAAFGTGEHWSSESTYFFTDRRDPVWEYLYAIRGKEVVVQKAVFPGYTSRTWYRHTIDSDPMMIELKVWAIRPGELEPPFVPGEQHPCRLSLSSGEKMPRGEAWFEDDSADVKSWFARLRREFLKPEYRIEVLPPWVADDVRVRTYFGIGE